jgi:hypothetical protein
MFGRIQNPEYRIQNPETLIRQYVAKNTKSGTSQDVPLFFSGRAGGVQAGVAQSCLTG